MNFSENADAKDRLLGLGLILGGLLLLLVAIFWSPMDRFFNVKTIEITINKAERVASAESSRYVVFSTDEREFEVTDSLFWWDFKASNRYNRLNEGATCVVVTSGARVGFFSRYPNIVEVLSCEKELSPAQIDRIQAIIDDAFGPDQGTNPAGRLAIANILLRVQSGDIDTADGLLEVIQNNRTALGL
jgi:hypothetical protein